MTVARAGAQERIARPPLLESKLRPPSQRQGTIPRTALVERLRLARRASVVVVQAPAGYGKTSLLDEWLGREGRRTAWYALDEPDNDVVTCVSYLAAALSSISAPDPEALDGLSAPGRSMSRIVEEVARAFAALPEPSVLALDDVHLARSPEAVAVLEALVHSVPPRSTLALATRIGLPFSLARLRADGRLVELHVDDLRLSDAEAGALLLAAGVQLAADEVAELNEKTEGWPAGLYLAALALRSRTGPKSIKAFRGVDRFVTDYFRVESLAHLSEEELDFLVRVSVLDRMCGPLCDAVLRSEGSAQLLASLAEANLFLVPLDADGHWLRFHRLFRDMLREELDRRNPSLATTLASRAADWCEANGDVEAAIEYANVAGDLDRMGSLVERAALPAYWNGRFRTVTRWFARLDDRHVLERHPALAVIGAWAHAIAGDTERARRWAAASGARPDVEMPDGSPARAWHLNIRAALCADGAEAMRGDAERAVAELVPRSQWSSSARLMVGFAHLLLGEDELADSAFADAWAAAVEIGAHVGASMALAERALLAFARGDGAEGTRLAASAHATAHDALLGDYGAIVIVGAASAHAALARGDVAGAQADLAQMESLLPQTNALPWLAAQARLELARLRLALGDAARAAELAAEVERYGASALAVQAQALVREVESTRRREDGWTAALTPAERRLVPLLGTYLSYREIAERFGVSRNTVKTQAVSIYRKLGVSSRGDAIERAGRLGLLDEPDAPPR